MSAPTPDLIQRLQEAAEEAKQTIRELHEARRDAKQAQDELQQLVATTRTEITEEINQCVRQWFNQMLKDINVDKLGAGLKQTFDQWIIRLGDANDVLRKLNRKVDELTELQAKVQAHWFGSRPPSGL